MSAQRSKKILAAFGEAIAEGGRWPRLLKTLDLEEVEGWPGPRLINDALEARGFKPVVDEAEALRKMLKDYPDAWWFAIAQETTGRRDATVQEVVDALNARTARHAAQ
ncbi:MAG: hypothetical protein WDN08_12540 [Rhizomicrobium sp.]